MFKKRWEFLFFSAITLLFILIFNTNLAYAIDYSCTDSDSLTYPTINYNTKGIVTFQGFLQISDMCSTIPNYYYYVTELYCQSSSSTTPSYTSFNCPYGCSDGACNTIPIISVSEKVPLGIALTAPGQLDADLDDGDISYLQDTTVNWGGRSIDISEHIFLSAKDNETAFHTSISSIEDDYDDLVRLEIPRYGLQYYYAMDQFLNFSLISNDKPLKIRFLGKNLKITGISGNNRIIATYADTYFLTTGLLRVIEGKNVNLLGVTTDLSIIDVDGETGSVALNVTTTINGLKFKGVAFFPSNNSAAIEIGNIVDQIISDGDPFVGEPPLNPNWKWVISGLMGAIPSAFINNASDGVTVIGYKLGVKNHFLKDTYARGALRLRECVIYPNNYVSVCFENLTVPDDKYMDLRVEYASSEDLSRADSNLSSSAPTILISTPVSEGLVVDADNDGQTQNWALRNVTSEKKTNKIWLYTDQSSTNYNATLVFYYDNDVRDIVFAGRLNNNGAYTASTVKIGHISYGNTQDEDAQILVTQPAGIITNQIGALNVTLRFRETTDFPASENLTVPFTLASGKIRNIGASAGGSTAEGIDLVYRFQGLSVQIGAKDENHRTRYGVVISNPTIGGSSDRMDFKVPWDLIQGVVQVGGNSIELACISESSLNVTSGNCDPLHRPSYCLNGTFIPNCQVCRCNPNSYCQADGSCKSTFIDRNKTPRVLSSQAEHGLVALVFTGIVAIFIIVSLSIRWR